MADNPVFFLVLSAALFGLGATGVAVRRNPLVMFMCIEMMLNAANLALLTFARFPIAQARVGGPSDGPVFVFVVLFVAAAEAVVGLAIIITIFRSRQNVDVDDLSAMRG